MKRHPLHAFSLLEILLVIGLIAGLALILTGGLMDAGKSTRLKTAQATLANLVTAARTKAPATSRKTRLLIHADAASPERYLRYLVLQLAREPGSNPANWDTLTTVTLPPGVYVVPASLTGLVADLTQWMRLSDPTEELASDMFRNQNLTYASEGDSGAQLWTGLAFTPNGTVAALVSGPPRTGAIIVADGQTRVPGTYGYAEPPIRLSNPQAVRGLMLSFSGVPALINDRSSL